MNNISPFTHTFLIMFILNEHASFELDQTKIKKLFGIDNASRVLPKKLVPREVTLCISKFTPVQTTQLPLMN